MWLTPKEEAAVPLRDVYHLPLFEGDYIGFLKQKSVLDFYAAVPMAEGESKLALSLCGHGRKYDDCGKIIVVGCDHVGAHKSGKVWGRLHKRNCRRKACPVCYESWAVAEAERGLVRMSSYVVGAERVGDLIGRLKKEVSFAPRSIFHKALVQELDQFVNSGNRLKPIHVVLSPPQVSELTMSAFVGMRNQAYRVARDSGLQGGSLIFHPYRVRCAVCHGRIPDYQKVCACGSAQVEWFFSPHFHAVGFGWISNTAEGFARHGWIVKNLGVRDSVFATFAYLLSHAGVGSFHTTTWFGRLAYNKFFAPKVGRVIEVCPECGSFLVPLRWIGGTDRPPPRLIYDEVDPFQNEFQGDPREWAHVSARV